MSNTEVRTRSSCVMAVLLGLRREAPASFLSWPSATGWSATVESARWGHPEISVSGESVEAIQSSPGSHRAVRAGTKYVRRFEDARIRASVHEASDALLRSSDRRSRGGTRVRRPTDGRVRIGGFESDAGVRFPGGIRPAWHPQGQRSV